MPAKKKATKKTTTKAKPAPVAKNTATPEAIFKWCATKQKKQGAVNKKEAADHFELTPHSLMATLWDYCARNGEVPITFATKGTSTPGTIKVRKQNKDSDSPVATLGPSFLRAIGIETGSSGALIKVDVDRGDDDTVATLTLYLLDEESEEEEGEWEEGEDSSEEE